MIDILIIVLMLALLTAFRLSHLDDLFSPWVLTVGVWLAIMVALEFSGDLLYPLSDQFRYSLLLWIAAFCGAALLTYKLLPTKDHNAEDMAESIPISSTIFNVFLVISAIITPIYFYRILQVVMQFDSADLLGNIRILALYGKQSYGFLGHSYVINHVLLLVTLWRYPAISKWKLITVYVVNFISALAIMEKGALFFIFIVTVFILFEKRIIKVRSILMSGIVIVLLFFFINIMRSLSADSSDDASLIDFIGMYILSPAVAFGTVTPDITTQFGSHSFNAIYLYLHRFGFDVNVHEIVQEFVYVPIPTNVYTIFQPFYQDYCLIGIPIFGLFYGTLSGYLYRLMNNGSGTAKCIYGYIVYILVLQFFQESLLMNLSMSVRLALLVWLITQQKYKLLFRSN